MRIFKISAVCLLVFIIYACSVFADEAVSVNISGTHIIKNMTDLKSIMHTFILQADDASYPMPAGSTNGKKEVIVESNSPFDFGDIRFTEKGTYEYTLTRKITNSINLEQDNSVYHIKIAIYGDGSEAVIYEKEGAEGKIDKIVYTDNYVRSAKISFDPAGGLFRGSGDVYVEEHAIGDVLTIPEAPVLEGHEFVYWRGSEYYPGDNYTVTEDHRFTAVYKEIDDSSDDPVDPDPIVDDGDDNGDDNGDVDFNDDNNGRNKGNNNNKNGNNRSTGVRTGDNRVMFLFGGLFATAIAALYVYRKK